MNVLIQKKKKKALFKVYKNHDSIVILIEKIKMMKLKKSIQTKVEKFIKKKKIKKNHKVKYTTLNKNVYNVLRFFDSISLISKKNFKIKKNILSSIKFDSILIYHCIMIISTIKSKKELIKMLILQNNQTVKKNICYLLLCIKGQFNTKLGNSFIWFCDIVKNGM